MNKMIAQGVFKSIENKIYSLNSKIDHAMDCQNDLLQFKPLAQVKPKAIQQQGKLFLRKKLLALEGATCNPKKEMNIHNYSHILAQKEIILKEDKLIEALLTKLKQKSIQSLLPRKRKGIIPVPFKFNLQLKKDKTNTCFNTLETSYANNDKPNRSLIHKTRLTRNRRVNDDKEFFSKTLNKSLFAIVKQANIGAIESSQLNKKLLQSKTSFYPPKGTNESSNPIKTVTHCIPKETQKMLYKFPQVTEYITRSSRDLYAFRDARIKCENEYKYHIS